MSLTLLLRIPACDLTIDDRGYRVIIDGIAEGSLLRIEEIGDYEIALTIADEDEFGEATRYVVDAFTSVDVLGD